MEKIASEMLDKAKDWIMENPGTATTIGAGLLGAGAGAAFTSAPDDPRNPKKGKLKNRITNALVAGGLGAGAAGLINFGVDQFNTARNSDDPDPITSKLRNNWTRLGSALGVGGIGGLAKLRKQQQAASGILSSLNTNAPGGGNARSALIGMLKHSPDTAVNKLIGANGMYSPDMASKMLGKAGISSKYLGKAGDLQGLKLLRGIKGLRGINRFVGRNKALMGATALGSLIPDGIFEATDWATDLLKNEDVNQQPQQ